MLRLALLIVVLAAGTPSVVQATGATLTLPAQDLQAQVCHKGLKEDFCAFIGGAPVVGGLALELLHKVAANACYTIIASCDMVCNVVGGISKELYDQCA